MEQQAQRERVAPPEAGFSVNFIMDDPSGCAHQITMRAAYPEEWAYVFQQMKGFKASAQEHGWTLVSKPRAQAAPPPVNKAAQIADSEGAHEAAAEIRAASDAVPPSTTGKPYQTVDVSEVRIVPQADGTIEVGFWNPGRKYAEERLKWKADRVAGLLKHVTSADVNKAQNLAVNCRVYFVLGKEKQNGGNWHDIEHVRPI